MKKISILLFSLLAFTAARQASASDWIWTGSSPWMYDSQDGQWYYATIYESAVWMINGDDSYKLIPAEGNTPATVGGKTMTYTLSGEQGIINFNTDGTFADDEGETGNYYYAKTGANTAQLTLLDSDIADGGIVFLLITMTDTVNGSATGRSTEIDETFTLETDFTIE